VVLRYSGGGSSITECRVKPGVKCRTGLRLGTFKNHKVAISQAKRLAYEVDELGDMVKNCSVLKDYRYKCPKDNYLLKTGSDDPNFMTESFGITIKSVKVNNDSELDDACSVVDEDGNFLRKRVHLGDGRERDEFYEEFYFDD